MAVEVRSYTLGKDCYATWSEPKDAIAHERGADGALTSEIAGFEIILQIVVREIAEENILAEEAIYVARSGGQIYTGEWTGTAPTRGDGETWPWPYDGISQPAASQFEFVGLVKRNSFGIGGLKIAFDCIWTFKAFVRNTT